MEKKTIVGITQGDVNGISYEVILKTLAEPEVYEDKAVVLYGSPKLVAYFKKNMELELNVPVISSADDAEVGCVSVINCVDDDIKVEPGQSTVMAGKAAFQALEAAVRDLKEGKIDVLVTAPINKNNIQSDVFRFPGHTEYLEASLGNGQKALMLMVSDRMRIAVATGHVSLDLVSQLLTQQRVLEKIELLNQSLKEDFLIERPRIAVLGLNPHAGDGGVIGAQDQTVIAPAVEAAQKQNICCFGPIAADGFFGTENYTHFDGVLAMYHDQGLIPFKALSDGHGVNFTAGLPYVRTSPAHGTAYELAGQNIASEASFREAFFMAVDIFNRRKIYAEMYSNPLPHQRVEHSGNDRSE